MAILASIYSVISRECPQWNAVHDRKLRIALKRIAAAKETR